MRTSLWLTPMYAPDHGTSVCKAQNASACPKRSIQRYDSPAEQCRKFPAQHRAVNFFQMGLQDFTPELQRCNIVLLLLHLAVLVACGIALKHHNANITQCTVQV